MRVSAMHVRALVEALGMRGVSSQVFLEHAGLDAQRLADPYGWFSVEEFDALLVLCADLTKDEFFGLHFAESSLMIQYDVLPPLVSQTKSLRDAIETIVRFQSVLGDRPEVEFTDRGQRAAFRLNPLALSPRGLRVRSEILVGGLMRLLNVLGGPASSTVTCVRFTHPCPPDRGEYDRIFGGAARFDQSVSALEFDYVALDSPKAFHNEKLHHALEAEAERVLMQVNAASTYTDRLKRMVQSRLPEIPSLPDAARSFGMSERSLRRRLSKESVSYWDLVKQSQVELACTLLDNPARSIKEVAHACGFADMSAFFRAFKRWTGTTPSQHRSRTKA